MKVSISQSELQHAISVVSKGASSRSTMPILSGILLRAQNESLTLEATDLNQSIRCTLPALIEEEGVAVVPAILFSNVVKKLPDAAVHLESNEDSLTILCDTTSVSVKTLIAQDFPGFPEIDPSEATNIPFSLFTNMVKKVERSVSTDETRPIFAGILVEVSEDTIKFVSTDSYRLAITEASFANTGDSFTAVIPGSFMREIASLNDLGNDISIGFNENQIVVSYDNYTFINRKIEGTYPNYNQLLLDNPETTAVFNVKQLADAVDRTSLLGSKTAPVKFDINNASQTVLVSSSTHDVGAAHVTISAEIEGNDIVIAFAYSYVLDGLRAIEGETARFELQNSTRPGMFREDGDIRYTYLIMPVRIEQ